MCCFQAALTAGVAVGLCWMGLWNGQMLRQLSWHAHWGVAVQAELYPTNDSVHDQRAGNMIQQ